MSDAHVRLRATHEHPSGAAWARPGGPWHVPALDVALAATSDDQLVGPVAAGLQQLGVGAGDTVAWQRPNDHDAVSLYRACWRLGAIAAPIHHRAGRADVTALLDLLDPRDPRLVLGPDDPVPRGTPPVRPGESDVPAGSLAVALATSGSTGTPKVVLHTHRALVYKARLMARVHELGEDDHVLMPAPLAHISGLLNGILVPGVSGMRVTLMDRWEPALALDIIDREQVTFMVGPPAFFVSLIDAQGRERWRTRSLRLVSCGGAGVTPTFVERASAELGCRVKRTYGSTEAPSVTSWTAGDAPARARDTDGRPVGAAELRVVRVTPPQPGSVGNASADVGEVGEVGEVQVRGPELFVGYSDPAATHAAFTADGWFRTGDLGRVDTEGWLTIVGRTGDVVIRGGENIAASEVATVLEAHPAVRQAVVVGVADERLGERVGVVMVPAGPALTLPQCREWFAARGITRFKWPEVLVAVDELPLLPSGKPDRTALLSMLHPRS
ncbi:MAG: class I adenylate-forming enzyme family protein [Acidimicrobiales bacterium]